LIAWHISFQKFFGKRNHILEFLNTGSMLVTKKTTLSLVVPTCHHVSRQKLNFVAARQCMPPLDHVLTGLLQGVGLGQGSRASITRFAMAVPQRAGITSHSITGLPDS
jgi:hypothetical protein